MSVFDQNRREILNLIRFYKHFECLWNSNNPDYNCEEQKQLAWAEIAKTFEESVPQIKRRVKYLRIMYLTEKKRVIVSRIAGFEYEPTLYYYSRMNFLDETLLYPLSAAYDEDERSLEASTLAEAQEEEELLLNLSVKRIKSTDGGSKRRRTDTPDYQFNLDIYDDTPEVAEEATTQLQVSEEEDNKLNPLFGANVSAQLDDLSASDAAEAMAQIQQVLSKKKVEMLQQIDADLGETAVVITPQAVVMKDEADLFSAGWAVQYRQLKPTQRLFAKRCVDEVFYQGLVGDLSSETARLIEKGKNAATSNPIVLE